MLLPDSGEVRRWTNSNLHASHNSSLSASRLVLQVSLCWKNRVDLNKSAKLLRVIIPESPRVAWLSVSSERCTLRQYCCRSVFPQPTKWDFQTLEWRRATLSIWLSGKVIESWVEGCAGAQSGVYPAFPPAPRAGAEVWLSWNSGRVKGEKRDWNLAPKQLCEEFRAGVDGACASNLNSCAKYAGAKSSWKCVGAVANSIEASALPPIPGGDYMEWDTDATLEWWSRVPILPTKGSGSSTLASLRAEYRIEKLIGSCQGKFAK